MMLESSKNNQENSFWPQGEGLLLEHLTARCTDQFSMYGEISFLAMFWKYDSAAFGLNIIFCPYLTNLMQFIEHILLLIQAHHLALSYYSVAMHMCFLLHFFFPLICAESLIL